MQFADSYALNENAVNMPTHDITVSFWAKTPGYKASKPSNRFETFVTYATHLPDVTTSKIVPQAKFSQPLSESPVSMSSLTVNAPQILCDLQWVLSNLIYPPTPSLFPISTPFCRT